MLAMLSTATMVSARPMSAISRAIFAGPTIWLAMQDVADPRRGHDFGLAKLGAGDADGAGRKCLTRDLRGLQPLDVRAPVDAAAPDTPRRSAQYSLP